jgi:hypothetical protein
MMVECRCLLQQLKKKMSLTAMPPPVPLIQDPQKPRHRRRPGASLNVMFTKTQLHGLTLMMRIKQSLATTKVESRFWSIFIALLH